MSKKLFSNGKIFGKINIIDSLILLFILLAITGLILVKTKKHTTSSNIIEGVSPVEFDVVLKSVRLTTQKPIFKINEESFITIRNVPYTALKIKQVEKEHIKTIVANQNKSHSSLLVDDMANPNTYNFIVSLEDKGIVTSQGVSIGGNKIKIGLPVTLEGFKYRLSGIVSDVRLKDKN